MWLYRHHTADDIIDLDHETGRWRPVSDGEMPPGAKVLADLPIDGSYEIEDEKRYYAYWAPDGRFFFRSFDGTLIEICHKQKDGSILMRDRDMRCTIEPARYADGRLRQGLSVVRILAGNGRQLYELTYNADYYRRLYQSDTTAAASERDLTDWDFFVALQAAFPLFRERSESGRVSLTIDHDNTATLGSAKIARDELLFAQSGALCPRGGVWAAVTDLRHNANFQKGERLPDHQGRAIEWVWTRER
ncbi:hypothetical protein [Piscinibacter sp. HJYY11]|uniref:hypothetical protein n=1 Tax=Piscinibacter sp. HJYY11 TaxID=2801333 RepID=UPI00191D7DC2|nr:hypothetical protein [Piscinibacter sp. HJYY11]MBL0730541.1 hypothetical protein [Piscinibacter sp. HJYY11]